MWKWVLGVLAALMVPVTLIGAFGFILLTVIVGSPRPGNDLGSCRSTTASAAGAAAPSSLQIPVDGRRDITLDEKQLSNASTIIAVGRERGVPDRGITVALMTALQESTLRNLANSSVPASLDYPHEGVGSDHDSVNPFQQRPSSGWGSISELMNVTYAATAFYGGPKGPNGGSPAGLLDIRGWEQLTLAQAAQRVQVSAYPTAYEKWERGAQLILQAAGGGSCTTGQAALPLDPPYVLTSGFGPRDAQGNASTWHAAVDLVNPGNACGKPVYAVLEGVVTKSTFLWLSIKHPDGFTVSYLHMYQRDHLVKVGDQVEAGQQIGSVGNGGAEQGMSFGCHLDLRIDVSGNTNPQVAQLKTVADLGGDPNWANYVHPVEFMRLFGVELLEAGQAGR